MDLGADLVVKTLDGLAEGTIQEQPQPRVEHPKNAFKIFKDDLKVNWNQDSKKIFDFIRGMSPYPCAFTTLKFGEETKGLKIFEGKYEIAEHQQKAGTLEISKNEFKIFTKDGIYYPSEVQLEGKKRMSVKDFLNGIRDFEHIQLA